MGRHKRYESHAARQRAYKERLKVMLSRAGDEIGGVTLLVTKKVTLSGDDRVTESLWLFGPEPGTTLDQDEAAQFWWAIGNVANCYREAWDAGTLETIDGMLAGVAGKAALFFSALKEIAEVRHDYDDYLLVLETKEEIVDLVSRACDLCKSPATMSPEATAFAEWIELPTPDELAEKARRRAAWDAEFGGVEVA